jgi:hypothetical protein
MPLTPAPIPIPPCTLPVLGLAGIIFGAVFGTESISSVIIGNDSDRRRGHGGVRGRHSRGYFNCDGCCQMCTNCVCPNCDCPCVGCNAGFLALSLALPPPLSFSTLPAATLYQPTHPHKGTHKTCMQDSSGLGFRVCVCKTVCVQGLGFVYARQFRFRV